MRKLTFGSTSFYILEQGERLSGASLGYNQSNFYIIWPVEDKWEARYRTPDSWEKVSDKLFNTSDDAFRHCHDDHLARDEKNRRLWRRD